MPSIAAHMVVAKLLEEKLGFKSIEFIKGNLLPDIIDIKDSHHKIKGKYYFIPDLEYFKNTLDLSNDLYLGYYTHLLLDQYFLEEFVPNNISNFDVFSNGIIYQEYTNINYLLVNKYHLDVEYLLTILNDFLVAIRQEKLINNLSCLLETKIKITTYLQFSEFSNFLENAIELISEEIKDYVHKLG